MRINWILINIRTDFSGKQRQGHKGVQLQTVIMNPIETKSLKSSPQLPHENHLQFEM